MAKSNYFTFSALSVQKSIDRTKHLLLKKKGSLVPHTTTILSLGMKDHHAPMAMGFSYSPEVRSSIPRSLGPVTLWHSFLRESNTKFAEKYKQALMSAFRYINGIDAMLDCIFANKSHADVETCAWILIMDIAMVQTPRTVKKGAPPPCMLFNIVNKELLAIFTRSEADGATVPIGILTDPYDYNLFDMPTIHSFDFSNHGLFGLVAMSSSEELLGPADIPVDVFQQTMFHATFGTMYEDHTVLEAMTSVTGWKTRDQIGEAFKGIGSAVSSVAFKPITPRLGSKLASACLTNLGPLKNPQIMAAPTFAGIQEQPVMQGTLDTILGSLPSTSGKMEKLNVVKLKLYNYWIHLMQRLSTLKKIDYGTVHWFKADSIDMNSWFMKTKVAQDTLLRIKGNNSFFNALEEEFKKSNDADSEITKKALKDARKIYKDWADA